MTRTSLPLLLACAALAMGCSEYSVEYGAADRAESAWDTGGAASTSTASEPDDDDDGLGSEQEDDFLKLAPAVTDAYVFVANTTRGTVTRIAVPELTVVTVDVGTDPTVVTTTSDYTRAVVFNQGSDDVSIIDAETLEVRTVAVRDNLNHMVVSDDGRWAIVYHDADKPVDPDIHDDGGIQSQNEISLVDLDDGEHFPMVVGFNPNDIAFTDDSTLVAVISDAYLAVLDLTVEYPSPDLIEIAEDVLDAPAAEEVVINNEGTYAFVRQYASDDIVVVDLATFAVERVPVGSNPTDLDLTPDGEDVVIVARGSNQVAIYDAQEPLVGIPGILDLPDDEVLGSILFSPDNTQAVLFTTTTNTDHYTTWDLADDSFTVRALGKPIDSMAVTPTGESLMAFHTGDLDSADPQDSDYGKPGLSLIDLDDFRSNLLILPQEPLAYANSQTGEVGFFIMEGEDTLAMLIYEQLLYDEVALKSEPVHVGVLPGTNFAYVNQEHDLGRLTFFDPGDPLVSSDDVLETITGFGLNSGIEHQDP